MNRLVLIGNGFDLAHGLKTKYEHFINWYWKQRFYLLTKEQTNISDDGLCKLTILKDGPWSVFSFNHFHETREAEGIDIYHSFKEGKGVFNVESSSFFENIHDSIDKKGWVDIENEYYRLLIEYSLTEYSNENIKELNNQLHYLQEKLVGYLDLVNRQMVNVNNKIKEKIYAPIKSQEISIERTEEFEKYIENCYNKSELYWKEKLTRYGLSDLYLPDNPYDGDTPDLFTLPDNILLLNFNYTNTADAYLRKDISHQIRIHGHLSNPDSIIFGYGDEIDSKYSQLLELNDNTCLQNIKSINYMESDNYWKVQKFADSAPFQICIMGHSCGNSDRTILNKLFNHKNCISIKPYYYIKEDGTDNYLEQVQNISRIFSDKKLMQERVVYKTYCEPLT